MIFLTFLSIILSIVALYKSNEAEKYADIVLDLLSKHTITDTNFCKYVKKQFDLIHKYLKIKKGGAE